MAKHSGRRSESRRELKRKAVDYKGGCCEICGYDRCLAALTFHHRDPIQKDFGISDIMNILSWQRIKRELDKCHLLCSNCHYEVHHGLVDGYIDGQ
jgi:hypothetical protein